MSSSVWCHISIYLLCSVAQLQDLHNMRPVHVEWGTFIWSACSDSFKTIPNMKSQTTVGVPKSKCCFFMTYITVRVKVWNCHHKIADELIFLSGAGCGVSAPMKTRESFKLTFPLREAGKYPGPYCRYWDSGNSINTWDTGRGQTIATWNCLLNLIKKKKKRAQIRYQDRHKSGRRRPRWLLQRMNDNSLITQSNRNPDFNIDI